MAAFVSRKNKMVAELSWHLRIILDVNNNNIYADLLKFSLLWRSGQQLIIRSEFDPH